MLRDYRFPLTPYSIQLEYMNKLYDCLCSKKGGLFESPTGTGKSLSIISASMTFLADHLNSIRKPENNDGSPQKRTKIEPQTAGSEVTQQKARIVYVTRTHLQLDQFTNELKRTVWVEQNLVKLTRLASKAFLCVNDEVNADETLLEYKCKLLTNKFKENEILFKQLKFRNDSRNSTKTCEFYTRKGHMAQIIQQKVCDIEDLVSIGKDQVACPYFGSRQAIQTADIIMGTYYSILNKRTREAMSLDLSNCYVIIDESHNIVDTMIDCYSRTLTSSQISSCIECFEVFRILIKQKNVNDSLVGIIDISLEILKSFKDFITRHENKDYYFKGKDFVFEYYQLQKIDFFDLWKTFDDLNLPFLSFNHQHKPKKQATKDLKSLIAFQDFLLILDEPDAVFLIKKDNRYRNISLKFMILDPYAKFKDSVKGALCVVLTGGTLTPLEEFNHLFSYLDKSQLTYFSCKHIAPSENLLLTSISTSLSGEDLLITMRNRERPSILSSLGEVLCNLCQVVPHGIVVFFQSYAYLKTFKESLSMVHLQEIQQRKVMFFDDQDENILSQYSEVAQRRGAIMFAVIRGSLSEGINFSDKLGRCVVVVGMPYLNPDDPEVIIKKKAYDRTDWYSGKMYYENNCDVTVNQCIGRAIRHQKDFAAIVLIDSRYCTRNHRRPDWMLPSLENIKNTEDVFSRVKNFFRDRINK